MSKVVITLEFPSHEAAAAALAKLVGAPAVTQQIVALGPIASAAPGAEQPVPPISAAAPTAPDAPTTSQETPAPRQRKPRSDAGKPRGSYKSTGESAASEPTAGGGNSVPASTVAAPTTPTTSEAPAASPTATPSTASAAPAASEPGKKLTIDDARAALKRISDTKGLGMEACMAHLQEFGVVRISDVKEADYALFIKQADDKVAEREKGGK